MNWSQNPEVRIFQNLDSISKKFLIFDFW